MYFSPFRYTVGPEEWEVKRVRSVCAAILLCGATAITAAPVTLSYAGWNAAPATGAPALDTLELRMIGAWNEAHPETPVSTVRHLDPLTWEESLASAARAGTLPDVFVIRSLPLAIANGWLADLTDLVFADPEWRAVPVPVGNAVFHDHAVIAVPFTQQLMGYFVNIALVSREKYPVPDAGWSVAQFEALVRSLARPQKQVLGLAEEVQIPEWYPAAVSPHMRWFSWDGRGYNLDSAEFIGGVQMARRFFTSGWVFDGLKDEQRRKFASSWPGEAWEKGLTALRWDGTWSLSSFARLGFTWEFIGVPGGRTPIVNEWLGISRASANRAAAYQFARWMSFSRAGSLARLKIAGAEGLPIKSLPLTPDPLVLRAYFQAWGTPGIQRLYASLDAGIVDGVNLVPGFEMSRWNAPLSPDRKAGDVIWSSIRGALRIEEWASALNHAANEELRKAP
jgi:multiple sugar transport system substrate-binding protein